LLSQAHLQAGLGFSADSFKIWHQKYPKTRQAKNCLFRKVSINSFSQPENLIYNKSSMGSAFQANQFLKLSGEVVKPACGWS
jgi:hypothetical protein